MNWQEILIVVLMLLLLICSGFIKRLTSALHSLIDSFDEAIVDGRITREEWNHIVTHCKGVVDVAKELACLLAFRRKA